MMYAIQLGSFMLIGQLLNTCFCSFSEPESIDVRLQRLENAYLSTQKELKITKNELASQVASSRVLQMEINLNRIQIAELNGKPKRKFNLITFDVSRKFTGMDDPYRTCLYISYVTLQSVVS